MAEQRTLDAELLSAADAVVERWHSRDWKAPHTAEYIARLSAAVGAVKHRAPPALDAEGLPELPEPRSKIWNGSQWVFAWIAEEVRQVQREAVEADRQGRAGEIPKRWQDRLPTTHVPTTSDFIRARDEEIADLHARLARQSAPVGAPVGMVLVPVEPTEEMVVAFAETWFSKARPIDDCGMEDCYAAMIGAAPTSASAQPDLLRCSKCGADRAKEPCGNPQACGMIGTAQAASAQPAEGDNHA